MPNLPVPPITRVYVLTEEEEVLVVSVAGAEADALERLPLLRQFLRSCEAAGWSTVQLQAEPGPEGGDCLPAMKAQGFRVGRGLRHVLPGGRRRVLH